MEPETKERMRVYAEWVVDRIKAGEHVSKIDLTILNNYNQLLKPTKAFNAGKRKVIKTGK